MESNDYRGSSIVVLVFDVTDEKSFGSLAARSAVVIMSEVVMYVKGNVEILVVGNKNDLGEQRAVSVDQGEAWALENEAFYLDFSAKEGSSKVFKSKLEEVANKLSLN